MRHILYRSILSGNMSSCLRAVSCWATSTLTNMVRKVSKTKAHLGVSKNREVSPKMDGEKMTNPINPWMIWGGFHPLFSETSRTYQERGQCIIPPLRSPINCQPPLQDLPGSKALGMVRGLTGEKTRRFCKTREYVFIRENDCYTRNGCWWEKSCVFLTLELYI